MSRASSAHVDTEKVSPPRPFEGMPAFSALLASDPDLQVYRSFNDLASRNLLCMQSELFDLEDRLRYLDEQAQRIMDTNAEGAGDVKLAAKSWNYALESERSKERVRIMREIRLLLAQYRT